MKGLRKILQVSWTAKKTNEWVLNKAGVRKELLKTAKAKKLAYYSHNMRKQGKCLEKEIIRGTIPGARRPGRPCTARIDNIKTWTGLPWKSQTKWERTEINRESTFMVWPTLESRTAEKQNRASARLLGEISTLSHFRLQPSIAVFYR